MDTALFSKLIKNGVSIEREDHGGLLTISTADLDYFEYSSQFLTSMATNLHTGKNQQIDKKLYHKLPAKQKKKPYTKRVILSYPLYVCND